MMLLSTVTRSDEPGAIQKYLFVPREALLAGIITVLTLLPLEEIVGFTKAWDCVAGAPEPM